MSISRALCVAICFSLGASQAFAQVDDDLLSPLTPKVKAKPKAKPKPKAPAVKPKPSELDVDLVPLVPVRGELLVQLSTPARNATLWVDDKEQGGFPSKALEVSVGEHAVQVKAPGFATWTSKVKVPANKTTEHKVTLTAIAARLSVTTDVPGAEVVVNGRVVGTAPVSDLEVPAGSAELVVRKEGFQSASQTVRLVAGKPTELNVRLGGGSAGLAARSADAPVNNSLTPMEVNSGPMDPSVSDDDAPIYQRWYFWAGVGVVAAAAVVGTVVGVSAAQPAQPLGPKGICGPDGCNQCLHCAATGLLKF